jgi:hypothetical protein
MIHKAASQLAEKLAILYVTDLLTPDTQAFASLPFLQRRAGTTHHPNHNQKQTLAQSLATVHHFLARANSPRLIQAEAIGNSLPLLQDYLASQQYSDCPIWYHDKTPFGSHLLPHNHYSPSTPPPLPLLGDTPPDPGEQDLTTTIYTDGSHLKNSQGEWATGFGVYVESGVYSNPENRETTLLTPPRPVSCSPTGNNTQVSHQPSLPDLANDLNIVPGTLFSQSHL